MPNLSKSLILTSLIITMQAAPTLTTKAAAKSTRLTHSATCQAAYKQGKASHSNNILASKSAIKNWSAVVASNLGASWSSWKHAKVKSLPCQYSHITQKWNCRAIAKPCHQPVLKKLKN